MSAAVPAAASAAATGGGSDAASPATPRPRRPGGPRSSPRTSPRPDQPPRPPTRAGGPLRPEEEAYWYSTNGAGRPSGAAGVLPITCDADGTLWVLSLIETRPRETGRGREHDRRREHEVELSRSWLVGKREVSGPPGNQRRETPAETAWREADEESVGVIRALVPGGSADLLRQLNETVWSAECKLVLYLVPVPWSADLVPKRTRVLLAAAKDLARLPDALWAGDEALAHLELEWLRVADLPTLAAQRGGPYRLSFMWRYLHREGLLAALDGVARRFWAAHGVAVTAAAVPREPPPADADVAALAEAVANALELSRSPP